MVEIVLLKWKYDAAKSANAKVSVSSGAGITFPPEIYIRVSEQLENEKAKVQQIGPTMQTDPAISSRLLTMVNSAFYGLPHRVSSISQAISLPGRLRLKHILIGSVLGGIFKGIKSDSFSMQDCCTI